jgi:hypothetical protein
VSPLAVEIDAAGVTHLVAIVPGASFMRRLAYVQIGPSAWAEP